MRKPVQNVCSLFLALALVSLNCILVKAWRGPGHHMFATISERHLTPQARQAIAEILGVDVSLASAEGLQIAAKAFCRMTQRISQS